ncbi:MAG TPA: helix-turn-helix transcriptional regulator [Actinophytocola sp.]|uniref:helix-turn-helix domain-containing protein n=1 Tax=Actinophytocola sp. TaxID=1872138 RepID=UPI002DDD3E5B|nr:helix-turn-helix transcriptional regulator [Actinophytocola sp.]HEV2780091.1 helix-turn-helix transcriptional regulator [Actinophytocola sp.]
MNAQPNAPFLRRRLGRRLKAMRDAAGLTLEEASARLDKTRSSLHRIETGATRADVHLIRSMMDLYDQWEEGLIDQVREANKPQWFRNYGVDELGYIDVETHARQVREFGVLNPPGLLQTEAYVRALLSSSRRKRTKQQIDNEVEVRLIRQRRLTDEENPLELVAIVDEAALRREVGGPRTVHEQLRQLVEAAAWPTVTLQVIPFRDGAHSGMDGAFTLVSFPEPSDPELLYVEHTAGALHIEDADAIRAAKLAFDQLRTEALSPADSVALIERIAGELDRP